MSQSPPPAPARRRNAIYLALITALAAALRLAGLGAKSLWLDEAASLVIARTPPSAVWHSLLRGHAGANLFYLYMSGYYFFLREWLRLGMSEFWLRLPSALFGIAAVPLLYLVGKRLASAPVALAAALLLAVSPFHIAHSQEARSYALVALLAIASFYFFARAVERNQPRWWTLYVLVSLLAVASHLYAVLLFPAQWLSLLFLGPRRIPWRGWLASAIIITAVTAPLCLVALTGDTGQNSWTPALRAKDALHGLQQLTGAGLKFAVILALLLLAAAPSAPNGERPPDARWRRALLWLWLLLPVAAVLFVSYFKPPFVPRYLMVSLPPTLLLAATGLERIRWRMAPLALALAAMMALALPSYYSRPQEDWRDATGYVLASAQPQDAICFFQPYGEHPFAYYRERSGRAGPRVVAAAQLLQPAEPSPRLWLVLYAAGNTPQGAAQSAALQAALARRYRRLARRDFPSLEVLLYGN